MWLRPSVRRAAMRLSPSSMESAMMPDGRGRLNCSSAGLLHEPAARRLEDAHPAALGRGRRRLLLALGRGGVWPRAAPAPAGWRPPSRPAPSCTRLTMGLPARRPARLRDLVHLEPVDLALVGEDQHVAVGGGDEEALHEVLVPGAGARLALAAAPLRAVEGDRVALHVAGVGDGDDHLLLRDQVLDRRARSASPCDLGAALVGELLLHLAQLVDDHVQQHLLRRPGSPCSR